MPLTALPPAPPKLSGRLIARAALSPAQTAAMYRILCDHFDGVSREVFDSDLARKEWVVLLEDDAASVRGFSTFVMYPAPGPTGETVAIVYSGDTIVDRTAWGTPTLPRAWIHSVYAVHREHFPGTRLHWLLITSGHRTYRFLPVFWREFTPRHDATPSPETRAWIDQLARDRFGPAYDPVTGIVRLASPQRLRPELRDIPPDKAADPHIAFFAARNPDHAAGDELVCLADLSPDNLTPAGRRMVYGPSRAVHD
jgi:hypothetical protein